MSDTLDKEARSYRMSLVKSKDTGPEMVVRRCVHRMGFRYRLHVSSLPGCPDLVLRKAKRVIFVHGCFWHRHADPACKLARLPKSSGDFWLKKLTANRERDLKNSERLKKMGWKSLVIWECQLKDLGCLETILRSFLCK